MKFTILTLFPEMFENYFSSSIMAKAVDNGYISYELVNIRDFAFDRHKTCDDTPYGGGAGMLLKPEPLGLALDSVDANNKYTVFATPSGVPFKQSLAQELSKKEEIVFICGRYEGIDQRIVNIYVNKEISIGDYIMSSGEVSTTVIIDTIYRLLDGVISNSSLHEESYMDGFLEYPQYTRPFAYKNIAVPDVLLSGNHENIRKWRLKEGFVKTFLNRPDLLAYAINNDYLNKEYLSIITEIRKRYFLNIKDDS